MRVTQYMFDWRREAETDGWRLGNGVWRNEEKDDARADDAYVYLGGGCWLEAWPYGRQPA